MRNHASDLDSFPLFGPRRAPIPTKANKPPHTGHSCASTSTTKPPVETMTYHHFSGRVRWAPYHFSQNCDLGSLPLFQSLTGALTCEPYHFYHS